VWGESRKLVKSKSKKQVSHHTDDAGSGNSPNTSRSGRRPSFACALGRPTSQSRSIREQCQLFASAKVVHNFRTMNSVLAGKTRIIRARAANIFAIDDCDALAFARKRPRNNRRASAAPENHQIKFFRLELLQKLGRMEMAQCSSCDFSFLSNGLTLGLH
jgi:hypothetical protein